MKHIIKAGVLLAVMVSARAQGARVTSPTLDSAGGTGAGGNFRLRSSLGQPIAIGESRGPGNIVRIGHQYALTSTAIASTKLFFPLFVTSQPTPFFDSYLTGIALVNLNTATANVTYTAYDTNGNVIAGAGITNPATRQLAARNQLPIFEYQIFGFSPTTPRTGWIEVASDQPLVGFFLLFDSRFASVIDGVDVSSSSSRDLIFTHAEVNPSTGFETFYSLCNPGTDAVSVVVSVRGAANADLGTRTISLRAKGQATLRLSDLLSTVPPGGVRGGYVTASSDRPVAGLQLFGTTRRLSALRAQTTSAATQLTFPHYAVRGGFTTDLSITNMAATTADLTLRAYGNEGVQVGSTVARTLASRNQLLESVETLFGITGSSTVVGYIVATSSVGGVLGFTNFTYQEVTSAAVPVDVAPRTSLVLSQVANDVEAGGGRTFITGVAVANVSATQTATYTLTVRDGLGNTVASSNFSLAPGAKVSKILSFPDPSVAFFTSPVRLGNGYITITSNIGIFGFELFFTNTLDVIAAVPGQ